MPFTDCWHRGFREKFRANLELIKLFCSTHRDPGLTMEMWTWMCVHGHGHGRGHAPGQPTTHRVPKSTKSGPPKSRLCGEIRFSFSHPHCLRTYTKPSLFWLEGIKHSRLLGGSVRGLWHKIFELIMDEMSWDKTCRKADNLFEDWLQLRRA